MSTIDREASGQERTVVFTKGAPDVLLALCSHELVGSESAVFTEKRREEIVSATEELASEALRTLGIGLPNFSERYVRCLLSQGALACRLCRH